MSNTTERPDDPEKPDRPDLPQGFEAGGLYCYPVGAAKDGRFEYVPGAPRFDSDDGRRRASLMRTGSGGVLACETVWEATEEEVAAAVEAILAARPELSEIDLRIADLAEAVTTLSITPDEGEAVTSGPNESSGWSSYRTVFQVTLDAAQAEAAAAALGGRAGLMTIEASGSLALAETVEVTISGDLVPVLRHLAASPETSPETWPAAKLGKPDACAAAVAWGLAEGSLTLTVLSGAIPVSRLAPLEAKARAAVAEDLRKQLGEAQSASKTEILVTRTFRETVRMTFDIRRKADPGAA